MIITVQHVRTVPRFGRKAGFCLPQARAWCARHGIDWRSFVRHGVDADVIEAIGDAFGLAVVQHARAMEAGRGQQ